jgi:hypothetical protein
VKGCRARTRRNARSVNNALAIGQIDREDNCLPAANFADSVPCSTEPADPMFRCAQPILPLLALLAVWSGAALAAQPGSIFLRYEVTGEPGLHFLTLQVPVGAGNAGYSWPAALLSSKKICACAHYVGFLPNYTGINETGQEQEPAI